MTERQIYKCRSYYSQKLAPELLPKTLMNIYHSLFAYFGPQNWWPADTKIEIIVGAILTQAVSWRNVEQAIANLKEQSCIDIKCLKNIEEKDIARLIKPAGYYNMKAKKIKAFIKFLTQNYNDDLQKMFTIEKAKLREELLSVYGVGPETADSIMLYAGEYPSFVVDSYSKRIFYRLGLVKEDIRYHDLKNMLENNLDSDVKIYNEYHALLVELGKNYCTKNEPDCKDCPLINNKIIRKMEC